MPDEFGVIVRHCRKHGVASGRVAELVFTRRQTFNGDEKSTAFGDPLRNGVWQLLTDRQIHAASVTEYHDVTKRKVGRVTPCAPSSQA